ncbi:MdtA/MuxA family multidrug efflux RND transporter periplasmic adaptor subunit [Geobacter sp. FeAm09]|uniref:MdtA/MuxA family multidrug efflux RND transporter periplasmic adaptor subunit n=1 Tax=Geobacter sp. FeAm09 TaxID=2597769 RepID=UPI0011ECD5DE|nr:MdtA/MuxA family multidrug efflux RND transporter periplasmic adaptor subunit [Geobacter sp. FeAm09]QEM68513.1 MdtA/MuxA family multidrug efflux RND transporter periplasmic adaptor subunit [Geobacter sp. FeAm09]
MILQSSQEETNNEPAENTPKASRSRLWWLIVPLLAVLAGGGYLYWGAKTVPAAKQEGAKSASLPVPVVAQAAGKADVGVYITGLGNVTPLNTVTVKSRIDGQIMEIRFREGQTVNRGDLLAVIDPRPYQVQLTQAEGQMARDQELLRNARLDLQRYKLLWQQDSIPKQQLDTQEALVRQYEGTVKVDKGAIDSAKLQLTYSRITAPISGRVGLRQVDAGNIIHASDTTGLVVITQLQPITVVFPVPEDNLPRVLGKMKSGARLGVDAFDREQKQKLATGQLQTIDNQIDSATGTVKFKAVFPNKDNGLFPNQFVNARLLVETRHDSVVVPASAIQRGSQGTFVYLVKADKTVAMRPVVIGVTQGDDIAITSGLDAGEMVVVDGAERLRDGSKVELREAGHQRGQSGPKGTAASGSPKGQGEQQGAVKGAGQKPGGVQQGTKP